MEPLQPTYTSAIQQMRAYRALRSHVQDVLDEYQLNSSQWAILGYLYEHPKGARSSDLATLLDVKPPLVSVLTTSLLISKFLISAEREGDRRSRYVSITPEGSVFVIKVEQALQLHLSAMFSTISAEDMRSYMAILQRVIDFRNL